jgi:uncharacterized membrane protein YkvA (DUF1232 family)
MLARLRQVGSGLKRELRVYRLAVRHARTPWLAKGLLLAALAYIAMPFDLIPDFLPFIGHLDDLIIVPGLIAMAIWLIPSDVLSECRQIAVD